jgi:iron complex transport system substrate-binding protein
MNTKEKKVEKLCSSTSKFGHKHQTCYAQKTCARMEEKMKTNKKHFGQTISVLLAISMLLTCTLSGCGKTDSKTTASNTSTGSTTASTASTGSTTAPSTSAEPSLAAKAADGKKATITDMAGRTVTFPTNPKKVFSSSPASEAWLCALVPDRMIGWANKMTGQQLAYYPKEVSNIPLVGGWYGYTEGNTEGIITKAPDVVISAYNLTDDTQKASAVKDADELSQKLGIPVICVSYVLNDAPNVMRQLGEWLGEAERGAKLADYLQGELDKVSATVAKVPADKVVSYYYAEDDSGLKTEAVDSFHAAVLSYCKLKCVTNVKMSSFMGMEQVSLENVIKWNPEYIFAFSPNAYKTISSSSKWADIKAVKDDHVYRCPSSPQNWFDRSPNALRILGCLYTAATCYPKYCTYDLDTEISQFFKTLYNRTLTTDQIHALYQ